MTKIIYNISGRSFYNNELGRKISEVINCWEKDNDIEVLCGGDIDNPNKSSESGYGNIAHHNQNFRKNKILEPLIHSISELKDILHDKKIFTKLISDYDTQNISLVWERSSRLHYSGLKYARKRNIPFVLEWKDHLIDYKFSFFKLYAEWVERYKNNNADYIVVESEVLKNDLIEKGIESKKIFVAYNAVNINEFKPSLEDRIAYRKDINILENEILVGYLGSYAFYHDTKRLILAANIIKKQNIGNIKFLLVGNGKEFKECYDLAENFGLIDNIIIFKQGVPKEDVPKILSAIDISVLPGSTDIICPIKVFEYMASKTLTLVPDHKCNKEVIQNNINGILFKAFDEKDLAKTIIEYSKNSKLIAELSTNARETVKEKYNWNNTWGKVMKEILKRENND